MKNVDLWQMLDELAQMHEVEWHWVKGHSGHPENELADQLGRGGAGLLCRLEDFQELGGAAVRDGADVLHDFVKGHPHAVVGHLQGARLGIGAGDLDDLGDPIDPPPTGRRAVAFRRLRIGLEATVVDDRGIDVVAQREWSDRVAREAGITHESPQAIWFRSGAATWHASHWDITINSLTEAVIS